MTRFLYLLLLFTSTSYAEDRNDKIARLMEAQGLVSIFEQQLKSGGEQSKVEGRRMLDQLLSQMNPSEEFRSRFEAAFEKYIAAVTTPWTATEIVGVWAKYYGAHFSDAELDELLGYYTSPLGQKEVVASKEALVKFSDHFLQLGRPIADSALQQYIADLRLVAKECKCMRANKALHEEAPQAAPP